MKYYKGLDSIRAIAVLLVIVHHWGPFYSPHTAPYMFKAVFIPDGDFGVRLFFVLSGFLITSILLHEKAKEGVSQIGIIKNFFIRRALRIFPIYYLTVLFGYLRGYSCVVHYPWYFITYTTNILRYAKEVTNELGHTWSLAVEEQFYLIWPWPIIFVNKKYIRHVLLATIGIGILSTYYVLYITHYHYASLVFNCFDAFGIGALYAYVRQHNDWNRRFNQIFVVLFPALLYFGMKMTPYGGFPAFVVYDRFLSSVVCLGIIMFTINNTSEFLRKYFFENKILNFIGRISYGIYLYHFIFNFEFETFLKWAFHNSAFITSVINNFALMYAINFSMLILLCWLSFTFIEQPLLRLKKKFEYTS